MKITNTRWCPVTTWAIYGYCLGENTGRDEAALLDKAATLGFEIGKLEWMDN